MENEQNKGYSGCLSTILGIGIFYQILLVIYNSIIAFDFSRHEYIPIIFIAVNILLIVSIILLLNYKKIGFYMYVALGIVSIFICIMFPDDVMRNSLGRNIIALCAFVGLMFTKNKETGLNGYETLGLIRKENNNDVMVSADDEDTSDDNKDDNKIIDEISTINDSTKKLEDNLIQNGNDVTKIVEYEKIISFNEEEDNCDNNDEKGIENENNTTQQKSFDNSKNFFLTHKKIFICVTLALIFIVAIVFLFVSGKSDEEKYKEALELLDSDKESSVKILDKLCQKHYVPALTHYGKMLLDGDKVQMNVQRGKCFLREASEKEDTLAQKTLGNYYFISEGKTDSAIIYLEQSINLGCQMAIADLSYCYYTEKCLGLKNPIRNLDKAKYYAEKVANNISVAGFILGQVYSDRGNNENAFYWWKKGAEMGNVYCLDNLGWAFHTGNGTNKNFGKAFECYEKALKIDSKDYYAHYMIGKMYKDGEYVCVDDDSAKYHLKMAADLGYGEAQELITSYYE